jgi:hypothetical protein
MSSILKGLNESVIPVTEESPIDIKIQNALWQAVTNESLSEEYINEIDPGMITNIMSVFPMISKIIVSNAVNKAKKEATETSNMISTMKKYRDSQPVTPEEKEQMMSQFKDLITYGAMAVGSVMAGMPAGPGIALAGAYKKEIMELIKTKGPEVLINLLQTKGNLDVIKILYHKLLAKNALPFYHPAPKGVAESQLDELSNEKLAKYKTAAAADAKKADSEGDYKRGDKRFSGIVKATKKEFDNDAKKELSEKMDSRFSKTEWIPLDDALKILKHYGARIEKWGGHESFYYYDREGVRHFVGDLSWNADDTRNVKLSLINQAVRHLRSQAVSEANNYHANRTGFSRGQRDDERHDLDVQQSAPQVWGLKINGKVWSKDGKYVTFKTKEAALNIRNSILKNRPDLEIGLITKGGSPASGAQSKTDDNFRAYLAQRKAGQQEQIDEIIDPSTATAKALRYVGRKFAQAFPWLAVGGVGAGLAASGLMAPIVASMGGITSALSALSAEMAFSAGMAGTYAAPSIIQTIKDLFAADENSIQAGIKRWVEKYVGDEQDVQEFMLVHARSAYEGKTVFRWRAKEWPVKLNKEQAEAYLEKNDKSWLEFEKQKAIDAEKAKAEKELAKDDLDENCWKGYHKEGNKELFGKTVPNCVKNEGVAEEQHSCPHCGGEMVSEELMNEKKDACYYKVKSRYKVWPSAYASGALVKCRKKGADSWGNGGKKNESSILEGIERADENLHKWFKEKWVRFGPDGKIRGDCARGDDSEGKPKCLPQSKAQSLGKKGRASAAARKRREDPNPERSGKAINVNTKKKSNESLDEGWKEKLGAAALAGSMALGAGAAHSRVTPDGQGGFTGGLKPSATVTAPSDDKPSAEAPKGFSKEYLQKAADPNRTGRYMISVEKAQELLKQMNEDQLDEKWSQKYKDSINCSNPKGFSQRAHCQGKNK